MPRTSLLGATLLVAVCCASCTRRLATDAINSWLSQHKDYRLATDADCDCDEALIVVRKGSGGAPVPNYHPYTATGDFNGDNSEDSAFVVVQKSGRSDGFALLIFNGPSMASSPSFIEEGLELRGNGLVFGPPRPKPYRLVMGPLESEGAILEPTGSGYEMIGFEGY